MVRVQLEPYPSALILTQEAAGPTLKVIVGVPGLDTAE